MLAQVVYITYTPLGKKWRLCTRRLAYYIAWIMVTWCILCIYDPKTSAFGRLQHICPSPSARSICTANFLWLQFGSYICGIHRVTMIYMLHTAAGRICHVMETKIIQVHVSHSTYFQWHLIYIKCRYPAQCHTYMMLHAYCHRWQLSSFHHPMLHM